MFKLDRVRQRNLYRMASILWAVTNAGMITLLVLATVFGSKMALLFLASLILLDLAGTAWFAWRFADCWMHVALREPWMSRITNILRMTFTVVLVFMGNPYLALACLVSATIGILVFSRVLIEALAEATM